MFVVWSLVEVSEKASDGTQVTNYVPCDTGENS